VARLDGHARGTRLGRGVASTARPASPAGRASAVVLDALSVPLLTGCPPSLAC
jgi:hypothetical protein